MKQSGILLPLSSLPSPYGIGTLGKEAYKFIDFLKASNQKLWQLLPIHQTSYGDSPYQSPSAFAGNPYFISIEGRKKEGVLTAAECKAAQMEVSAQVDYETLNETRLPLLRKAYERSNISQDPAFAEFCRENSWWLEDYALYMAVKEAFGNACWTEWEEDIRMRRPEAVKEYTKEYSS